MRVQYLSAVTILAAALTVGQAAAQGATGFPIGDVGQVLRQAEQPLTQWAPPPSPLERLSRKAKDWIKAETDRQTAAPRRPILVLMSIESMLDKDAMRLAKRERIRPDDIHNAILMRIMMEAEQVAAREAESARRQALQGGDVAVAKAAYDNLMQASTNREWAGRLQSENSLLMAAM